MLVLLADLDKADLVRNRILLNESFDVRRLCGVDLSYDELGASLDGFRLVALLVEVLIAYEDDKPCSRSQIGVLLF